MEEILKLDGISGGYGAVDILQNLHIAVAKGQIVVLIGPNGAGKSSAIKSVFGLLKIRSGEILFHNSPITNKLPDQVVRLGIGYVPQTDNIFPSLTVEENLEMGAFIKKNDKGAAKQRIFDMFPPLKDKRKAQAGSLSGGQRQMVAIGKAMMLAPSMLLLDEPTAGLSPKYAMQMFDIVKQVNDQGVTILMVEQNARQALEIADWGYVLSVGSNRHADTGANLLKTPEIAEMFLGG